MKSQCRLENVFEKRKVGFLLGFFFVNDFFLLKVVTTTTNAHTNTRFQHATVLLTYRVV